MSKVWMLLDEVADYVRDCVPISMGERESLADVERLVHDREFVVECIRRMADVKAANVQG